MCMNSKFKCYWVCGFKDFDKKFRETAAIQINKPSFAAKCGRSLGGGGVDKQLMLILADRNSFVEKALIYM